VTPPQQTPPETRPPASTPGAGAVAATAVPTAVATTIPAIAAAGAAVVTARAAARITSGVVKALTAFAKERESWPFVVEVAQKAHPGFDFRLLDALRLKEAEYEKTFLRKQEKRVRRDLPGILALTDPAKRQAALAALLEREKRFTAMREEAMLDRLLGEMEATILQVTSPQGAFWKLNPNVKNHTLDCLAMGEKFWPWAVLKQFHPPLHHGCPCSLWGLDEAIKAGFMSAEEVPDPRDAIRRYRQIQDDLKDIEEAGLAEAVYEPYDEPDDPREWIIEAATHTSTMVALFPDAKSRKEIASWGTETARDIHLTLAFLGKFDGDEKALKEAVKAWAATCPPIHGEVSGTGYFTAGETNVAYASADLPLLPHNRERLVDSLRRAGFPPSMDHGFTPHITLGYGKEDVAAIVAKPKYNLRFDKVTLAIGDRRFDFDLTGSDELQEALSPDHPRSRRKPLRWAKGYVKGGQFRPQRGTSARVKRLIGGDRRGRWAWVGGQYVNVPLSSFTRKVGPHTYTSPAGGTNVYRDGEFLHGPGIPAPASERRSPGTLLTEPQATVELAEKVEKLREQMRATPRRRALRTNGPVPVKPGDSVSSLLALEDVGYILDRMTPGARGRRVLEFREPGSQRRLRAAVDSTTVSKVDWLEPPALTEPRRRPLKRAPKSWAEFRADTLSWANELGDRFGAEVITREVGINDLLADHAGTHQWSGDVELGRDVIDDIDRAGLARQEGRELTASEAKGVWSSYWVAAHEVSHGVNPIDPFLFQGENARLEEALAEESAHILATERLTEQNQEDVLKWRAANPEEIAVRGVYQRWRDALSRMLTRADITDWGERKEFVYALKFGTDPDRRFDLLAEALHDADRSRSVEEWEAYARASMLSPSIDPDTGEFWPDERGSGAIPMRSASPGMQAAGHYSYGRFAAGTMSDDGRRITMPDGTRRVIEHIPVPEWGPKGLTSGTAIVHYAPEEAETPGSLERADGRPKNFRWIDSEWRAKEILRAFHGMGSPGATLVEDGSLYFNLDTDALDRKYGRVIRLEDVPLDKITPVRARPQGIANAEPLMAAAAAGMGGKRDPITLVRDGDGYRVYDGNSTFAIAQKHGWESIPAMVVDTEEEAADIERTAKALKATMKSPGTLFDDDDDDLWSDANDDVPAWQQKASSWLDKLGGDKGKGKKKSPWVPGGGMGPPAKPYKKPVNHGPPPPRVIGGSLDDPAPEGPIPNYDHIELTLKTKPGPGTLSATDEGGGKWFVNEYEGDDDRVASEVLAAALYRAAGLEVPATGTMTVQRPDFSTIPDVALIEAKYQRVSTGIILVDGDGKLWLYEPRNHYGGYEHTFPKGGVEKGLTPQQNAHKELWEETGLHGRIFGVLGDFKGDTTTTRYYVGVRTGGEPTEGDETFAVKHVTFAEARDLLNKKRDQDIMDALEEMELPDADTLAALADHDPFPPLDDAPVAVTPELQGTTSQRPKGSKEALAAGFMVDALLGNWDFSDVRWKDGKPVRTNLGGTLGFRKDGSLKNFGPIPTEVWTLLSPRSKGAHNLPDLSEDDRRHLAAEVVEALPVEKIDELVNAAPFRDPEMREHTRNALLQRLDWMKAFSVGDEDLPGPLDGDLAAEAVAEHQAKLQLIPAEVDAVKALVAGAAPEVNAQLRSGKKGDNKVVDKLVRDLDGLFRFSKGHDEDMFVYAGLDMTAERAASEDLGGLVGKTFEEKGYLDAHYDIEPAKRKTAVLRVLVPAGQKMLGLNSLPKVDTPAASDVLLPRAQRFRITGRSVLEDGTVVVEAIALPPEKPMQTSMNYASAPYKKGK
jgi:2'-5' RNA ligase/8-oxo-dGTP pyrophosphatase MutT (NUDIX family)